MVNEGETLEENKYISKVQAKIHELRNFAKNNRNVHKEVKQIAGELKTLMLKLKNEYRHIIEKRDEYGR